MSVKQNYLPRNCPISLEKLLRFSLFWIAYVTVYSRIHLTTGTVHTGTALEHLLIDTHHTTHSIDSLSIDHTGDTRGEGMSGRARRKASGGGKRARGAREGDRGRGAGRVRRKDNTRMHRNATTGQL